MIAEKVAQKFSLAGLTLSTVESCTGGGIAHKCTDLAGSSAWFSGGLVTYSNEMKIRLGVDAEVINRHGAVSEQVVLQMAQAGRTWCQSDWCVSVSGIAGPAGGTAEKSIGTVWLAWAGPHIHEAERKLFHGNRASVREQAVYYSLQKLFDFVN